MKGLIEMKKLTILKFNNNITIDFATKELSKYLNKITGLKYPIKSQKKFTVNSLQKKNIVFIGLLDGFNKILKITKKSNLNDEIIIRTEEENLIIAGNNPRSVLFSVYTFLNSIGVRWLYPGSEGEIIKKINNVDISNYNIHHIASLRYRGICNEGAIKINQAIDFIDWMAKNKMNHFFMQFESLYYFYKRYDKSITKKKAEEYDKRIIVEIKKRDMILERVGHGWINKAIGFGKEGWEINKKVISLEKQKLLAKVNGKREIWKGVALNTQMCMTNNDSIKKVINYVCNYAKKHKEIDILAFWIADGFNNLCECKECLKNSPTDLYLKIANEISIKLRKINTKLKLEILVYANILNPPKDEMINKENENIVFAFAPMTRCHTHIISDSYCSASKPLKLWPIINRIEEPKNKEYWGIMKSWLKILNFDSYIFEYYYWPVGKDFIRSRLSEIIYKEIKKYSLLGFNGLVSCQTYRSFWPTGIPMYVLSHSIWDSNKSYNEILDEYLEAGFGSNANFVKKYIKSLYDLLVDKNNYSNNHHYFSWIDNLVPEFYGLEDRLVNILEKLLEKRNKIKNIIQHIDDSKIKKRMFYIRIHLDYLISIYKSTKYFLENDTASAVKELSDIVKKLDDFKFELENICDLFDLKEWIIMPRINQYKGIYISKATLF